MFKAVIIGCGKIAGEYDNLKSQDIYSHAKAYYTNPDINVVSYIDQSLEKAKNLASIYQSTEYSSDLEATLKKWKPDVVSICTPIESHFSISKEILDLNLESIKILFLEKPACSNIFEFNLLENLSIQKNIPIIINHSRRFHPKIQFLKKQIKVGILGRFIRGDIFYYGGWENNGVHIIDTLNFLLDMEFQIDEFFEIQKSKYKNDPTISLKLICNKTNSIIFINGFDETFYQIFDFDLKFDNCRLRIENFESSFILQKKFQNSMNENILVNSELEFDDNNKSPIQNAISIISDYLSNPDKSKINPYLLQSIGSTMKIIWSKDLINKESI